MTSCCTTTEAEQHPCPACGRIGPVVGEAPVRAHHPDAAGGGWQSCATPACQVVFHLGADTVQAESLRTRVGDKGIDKPMPVCFCFGHTTEALAQDLAANDGSSQIKASVKTAVAQGQCACEHLNPSGRCCLADISRALAALTTTTSTS